MSQQEGERAVDQHLVAADDDVGTAQPSALGAAGSGTGEESAGARVRR